jgi:hypothetical protein
MRGTWDTYAIPLNDKNLSLVRTMIEDAGNVESDYMKDNGHVYYPKSQDSISFEIKSILWADSKPQPEPEGE